MNRANTTWWNDPCGPKCNLTELITSHRINATSHQPPQFWRVISLFPHSLLISLSITLLLLQMFSSCSSSPRRRSCFHQALFACLQSYLTTHVAYMFNSANMLVYSFIRWHTVLNGSYILVLWTQWVSGLRSHITPGTQVGVPSEVIPDPHLCQKSK